MEKKYLVTGFWTDKVSGKTVSGIVEVSGGINKNGNPYEIANTDKREEPIIGMYPVGTILTATMNLTVQENDGSVPQEQRAVKLNPKQ